MATIKGNVRFSSTFTKLGKCYSLLVTDTKKGNKRAYINGKYADKCSLGYLAKPCTYASIYWYQAKYEDVLRHMMYDYFGYKNVQQLFNNN